MRRTLDRDTSNQAQEPDLPGLAVKERPVESCGSVTILPPKDVLVTLQQQRERFAVVMLDPWYNKGVGGTRSDYEAWLAELLRTTAPVANHIFLWGFPEIVAGALHSVPEPFGLTAWLTWYFKNCPSVIRGWRSAQMACLHLARPDAKLYPEHFLNDAQLRLLRDRKLRYMPGPASVIEAPLNIGFVGRREQTGHPAQKPESVYETLLQMTTREGDSILDPMCGSGTTGAVCRKLGRRAVLCDSSEEFIQMTEKRLGVMRTHQSTS